MVQQGQNQATFTFKRDKFNYKYKIDLSGTCSQKNIKTGVTRRLKRQEEQPPLSSYEQQKVNPNVLLQSLQVRKQNSGGKSEIYLVGQKDKVDLALATIQSSILVEQRKIIDVCKSHSLIINQPIQYQQVKKFEKNHPGLKVLLNNDTFQLQGFCAQKYAKPFRDYVQQVQLTQMKKSEQENNSIQYPPQWTNTNSQDYQKPYLYELSSTDLRYQQIEQHFNQTCKSKISKIERIQSLKLWDRYYAAFNRAEKEKRPTNVKFMFHGSGQTRPQQIYDSQQGFDIRFAQMGMWGTGTYFAKNSSYSHKYNHKRSNGEFQMFYARLQVGNSFDAGTNSNKSLTKPPPIQNGKNNQLYDSVSANIQNTDIVILYSNQKSYPQFLITYK